MNMIKKDRLISFLPCVLVSCYLLLVTAASAAIVFPDSDFKKIGVGQQVKVDLFLNTEDERVNAIEGELLVPAEFFAIKEIYDGNSIVNLWIKKPVVNGDKVVWAGAIPNGFIGDKGFIFSVILEVKKAGGADLLVDKLTVLRNDKNGSEVRSSGGELKMILTEETQSEAGFTGMVDAEEPEEFVPYIARDADLLGNKWFLVFTAQDKGSGISHYEVSESAVQKGAFKSAEAPYLLQDQSLKSKIRVKAVDKNGNFRIVTVDKGYTGNKYKNKLIWGIIILIAVLALVLRRFWANRRGSEEAREI